MTDATLQPADRTAAMLDRLAEMDLSAAEHVHAQLLATTEPKALAELARAYQRPGRRSWDIAYSFSGVVACGAGSLSEFSTTRVITVTLYEIGRAWEHACPASATYFIVSP